MAGRSTPQDPNYKLYGLYGGKDKYLAAKKARDAIKYTNSKDKKAYELSNKILNDKLNSLDRNNLGLYAQLSVAKYNHNQPLIDSLNAEIRKIKAKITLNYTYIYLFDANIKDAQDAFDKKNVVKAKEIAGAGDKGDKSGKKYEGKWLFNAPLVTASNSALDKASLPKMISAGSSPEGDALKFWTSKENGGGKGTIQMDRATNTLELRANAQKSSKDPKNFDPNFYGFKFHYNPTTVNMSWSGMMGANPVYEAASLDPAVPMASSLFTGNITFDIILNRIHDLALLDENGGFKTGSNPYEPVTISLEDRKMIVQKGTMYDLEYLFHAMHGFMSSTNFTSSLMQKTNDPGWLPVRPVELHLGNKLRYRVRISNLEVVHKIFSEKMVPLLSVVSFSCARYWDGPVAKDPKK